MNDSKFKMTISEQGLYIINAQLTIAALSSSNQTATPLTIITPRVDFQVNQISAFVTQNLVTVIPDTSANRDPITVQITDTTSNTPLFQSPVDVYELATIGKSLLFKGFQLPGTSQLKFEMTHYASHLTSGSLEVNIYLVCSKIAEG